MINHGPLNSERFLILCVLNIFLLGVKVGPFGDVLDSGGRERRRDVG